MLQALYYILEYRADLILAVLLVGGACWGITRTLRRRGPQYRIPTKSFLIAAGLVVLGGITAEWAARDCINQLMKLFAGVGPTYAYEFQTGGHEQITLKTSPDDPAYLQLIESEKRWLNLNPAISDIYTFRQDEQGRIRLIVDSETDYDRNGKIDEDREQRTAIGEIYEETTQKFYRALKGETVFESEIIPDRWGIWVSSFTPVYGKSGQVEAAVGIDYPADSWLHAIAGIRAVVLGLALVVSVILLVSSTLISILSSEVEERRDTQAQLERASESAFNASAAKSEFLARMSHEVRNPLTAILGFARFLSETDMNAKQRRYVDTIDRAGANLLNLLNDVLDYTKAESGKLELERIAWAPAVLIHEVIELMSVRATEKEIQLNFDNRLPGTLTLFGDPTRVRQILINLLSNAVKFTPLGHVTVKAIWTPDVSKQDHGQLSLQVIDTGLGIPADRIPRLFNAFTQADTSTSRQHGGTGLGLAICKRLSDMMGGSINLESQPGKGTTFTFLLGSDAAYEYGPTYPQSAGTAPPIPMWTRALVVDDTKLNRDLLKVTLNRLGLEADTAANGAEAVRLTAEQPYAIIFIDIEMPVMNGYATARKIREQEPAGRHTPIVAISELHLTGTRERCIVAGMDDYMTKPVYLPALKSAIEASLPRFKVAQAETRAPFATV